MSLGQQNNNNNFDGLLADKNSDESVARQKKQSG